MSTYKVTSKNRQQDTKKMELVRMYNSYSKVTLQDRSVFPQYYFLVLIIRFLK